MNAGNRKKKWIKFVESAQILDSALTPVGRIELREGKSDGYFADCFILIDYEENKPDIFDYEKSEKDYAMSIWKKWKQEAIGV